MIPKRISFAALLLLIFFSAKPASAQITATDWISSGKAALRKQTNAGLQEAKTAFARASQLQPTNGEAVVLEVLATVAAEALRPEFRQEIDLLGVEITEDNIYAPSYEYPEDEEGDYLPPPNVGSARAVAYANTRLSEANRLLGLLQRITDSNFNITLSAEETGLKSVRVDYVDVRLLRVVGHLLKASLAGANSYNLLFDYHQAFTGEITLQQFLTELPDFFKFTTAAQRSEVREQLRLANIEFQGAVDLYLRNRSPHGDSTYLFDFNHAEEAEESAATAQFLASALYGPQTVPVGSAEASGPLTGITGKRINLAPLFTSAIQLRDLLPTRYDRGFFRRDSWPSATFGGVLGSPDTDLLNQIGGGLGLVQRTWYEPYDFSLLVGSDAPPPWSGVSELSIHRPFTELTSIVADKLGNVYAADAGVNVIRKLSPDGTLTVVAGQEWTTWEQKNEILARSAPRNSSGYPSVSPSNPSTAVLDRPRALAIDGQNNLFFASGRRVFRLAADGTISVLAGRDDWSQNAFLDGIGGAANFLQISVLAVDRSGNVFVVDSGSGVRKITPQGVVTTFAGGGDWRYGFQNGAGSQALFSYIQGIAVDSRGDVYVTDSSNGVIRRIDTSGNVTTFAGSNLSTLHFDAAIPGKARLNYPQAITIDAQDNIYFTDGPTIRKISAAGAVVTIAGKQESNDVEKLGVGENARFAGWPYELLSLSAAPDGKLYAANYRSIIVGRPVSAALATDSGGNVSHPGPGSGGPPWPEVPEVNPPTGSGNLQSLALGKTSVTLNGQEDTLEVTGAFSGTLTNVQITFAHQQTGASVTGWANLDHPTAPRNTSGVRALSFPLRLPAGLPAGLYTVSAVSFRTGDDAGSSHYHPPDIPEAFRNLSFTVVNNQPIDTTPPVPLAVEVVPGDINPDFYPSEGNLKPRVRFTISESSDLSSASLSFYQPATYDTFYQTASASFGDWQLVAVNGDQKTYEADLSLPEDAVPGEWRMRSVWMSDAAGNSTNLHAEYGTPLSPALSGTVFRTGGYQAYVPPADTTPPSASLVEISPVSVDLSSGQKSVIVRRQVSDDVSGVEYPNISFNHGSNGSSGLWASQFKLVSGTSRNGTYQARVVVPPTTPNGTYVISYVSLQDRAGNSIGYYDYAEAPWGRPLTTQLRKTLTVSGGGQPPRTGSVTAISAARGRARAAKQQKRIAHRRDSRDFFRTPVT